MGNTQTLIAEVYSAFNRRDIDGALALMSESVSWPKASEGGRVVGKEEFRAYWSCQWKEFDPHVEPIEVIDRGAGKIHVRVHRLVKGLGGVLPLLGVGGIAGLSCIGVFATAHGAPRRQLPDRATGQRGKWRLPRVDSFC